MNKIEKQDVILDFFMSDITSITRICHLSGVEQKHFLKKHCFCFILKNQYSSFGSGIYILLNEILRIWVYHRSKKISILVNDWDNIIVYWEEFKQSKTLTGQCCFFNTVNSWWEADSTQPQPNSAICTLI